LRLRAPFSSPLPSPTEVARVPPPPRLRLRPSPRLFPGDLTPRALRRALRTRAAWIVGPEDVFDQPLLLARTPGGPSLWAGHPIRPGRPVLRWSVQTLEGRAAPPPPFPANPFRISAALRDAFALVLPLLPGRARRQATLLDLLRRAHGAETLTWEVISEAERGRGFVRLRPRPFRGEMRLQGPGREDIIDDDADALRAAVPPALARILFPPYARTASGPEMFLLAEGPLPSAHVRLAARAFLAESFGS
jgi:hypothetical protein